MAKVWMLVEFGGCREQATLYGVYSNREKAIKAGTKLAKDREWDTKNIARDLVDYLNGRDTVAQAFELTLDRAQNITL